MSGFILGATKAGEVNEFLGIGVATTGLCVGIARYITVLRGARKAQVEKATGAGFFLGLVAASIVIGVLLLT